jgi:selenocysteine-specific translation elongation factor
MKNLTVGIFHDEELGRELGKRGTESDIAMFNRKAEDCVYTFMQPVGNKLLPKAEIMSSIDAAIINFTSMTPEVGETILLLDTFGISHGIVIVPTGTEIHKIVTMTKGTSLESFVIKHREVQEVFGALEHVKPERDMKSPAIVVVDHSFSVRGVGEVVLGFVKQGVIRKHDKLLLMPAEKEIVVRSIQMQDRDFDEAEAGSRVGLAIKGATVDEMRRGCVLCMPGAAKAERKLTLRFEKNKFYKGELKEGTYHMGVGMQTVPVKVSGITDSLITIESEKPLVYSQADVFVLLDINAKGLHLAGKGLI